MKRCEFIALLGGAVAWPLAARAQPPEQMRRVGALVGLPENDPALASWIAAFEQTLQRLGWSLGHNVRIDYRYAPAGAHVQTLAKEIVATQPDVILSYSTPASLALQQESRTIPIVFVGVADPIGSDCELSAAGRESHRSNVVRRQHHRQMAFDAQRDFANPQARRNRD